MSFGGHIEGAVYLDRVSGSDSNPGSSSRPVLTMAAAVKVLGGQGGGTVYGYAPQANPIAVATLYTDRRPLTIRPWRSTTLYWDGGGAGYCFRTTSPSQVLLFNEYFTNAIKSVGGGDTGAATGSGLLTATDCYAEGSECGWSTQGVWTTLTCLRCTGKGGSNDGFNIHGDAGVAGVATLTDCIGDDCGDEGASPHDDTILNIIGGHYNHNGSGGATAVNNSTMNISGGAQFLNNHQGGAIAGEGGVTYYEATVKGSCSDFTVTGDAGPGLFIKTGAVVAVGSYTSSGNGAPDNLAG